jgi:hypothetical protein
MTVFATIQRFSATMTREIEIEISDQSDLISLNILKEKKRDVQKLIDDLSAISSNYTLISVFQRYSHTFNQAVNYFTRKR